MASNELAINGANFWRHVETVYGTWPDSPLAKLLWEGTESICLLVGQQSSDEQSKRSNQLSVWLTGYELTDTMIVFLRSKKVVVLASQKKVDLLKPLQSDAAKGPDFELELLLRPLQEPGSSEAVGKAMALLKEHAPVGLLSQHDLDQETSKFAARWKTAFFDEERLERTDCTAAWTAVLSVKGESELADLKMSASISNGIMTKLVIRNIEQTIDEDKKTTHRAIEQLFDEIIATPAKISRRLNPELVESGDATCIQSGGQLNLRRDARSNDEPLSFDTIVCSLAVKYAGQATAVSRTLLIDAPAGVEQRYQLLLELQRVALGKLQPGVPASSIYKSVRAHVEQSAHPELLDHLLPDCGSLVGASINDEAFLLDASNDRPLLASSAVHLRLGFTSLGPELLHPETRNPIALLLSDTVLLAGDEGRDPQKVLTSAVASDWTSASYATTTEEAPASKAPAKKKAAIDEADEEIARQFKPSQIQQGRALRTRTGGTQTARQIDSDEKSRRQQEKIRQRRIRELQQKYVGSDDDDDDDDDDGEVDSDGEPKKKSKAASSSSSAASSSSEQKWTPPTGFSSASEYPTEANRNQIFVDHENEIVLFPIYGLHVPFHATTIKNVTHDSENNELRVNFVAPLGGPGPNRTTTTLPAAVRANPNAVFVRELVFKGGDQKLTLASFRKIQELTARIRARETMRKTTEGLRKQDSLVLVRGRPIDLPDVRLRPFVGGTRVAKGRLEAHKTGYRYLGPKGVHVDILYENVRHAFYQQANSTSHFVILHFHLHHPIMIGKTKTQDVQVYYEVTEGSRDLSANRDYDEDGIEEEAMERRMRAKYNRLFLDFCKNVRHTYPDHPEFEVPYDDLAFTGVPGRSSVLLKPTVHCLVHLTDMPFFVLSLEEVEVAFFERVQFGLRNFDLVFVFGDYDKPVATVGSIAVSFLDAIKKWLTECGIMWYENPKNFNWKTLMNAAVKDDVRTFWKNGGWAQFEINNESESGEESDSESADEWAPDSEEDSGSAYSDSDASYSDGTAASDSDAYSEEEDDEEAPDWDELDRRAAKEDRHRKKDWEEDEYRPKPKGAVPAKPPAKSAAKPATGRANAKRMR